MGRRAAFSLMELVIVITIMAIIAAIAIRRVGRHAETAGTSAAGEDTVVLQAAIERYRAEHGTYPTASGISDQLTKYTDDFGNVSPTRTPPYTYGPYLRRVPPVPIGPARNSVTIGAAAGAGIGWIYDSTTGDIHANEGS